MLTCGPEITIRSESQGGAAVGMLRHYYRMITPIVESDANMMHDIYILTYNLKHNGSIYTVNVNKSLLMLMYDLKFRTTIIN